MSLIPLGKKNVTVTVSNTDDFKNQFEPPADADAITVEYPDSVTEIFRYRSGGTSGTVIKSVQVIYQASNKKNLLSVEVL